MDSESFKASRLTRGNIFFPTVIEISENAIIRHKRSWFSKGQTSYSMAKVASVHVKTGMFWADVVVESSVSGEPLKSRGHKKRDALRMRDLIQAAQGAAPESDTLPHAGEKLKLS
jgi:hypothetical protein